MNTNSRLIATAQMYATKQHAGQTRDDGVTPYAEHLRKVAEVLSCVTDDEHLIAAAWLHDTLEDTPVTYTELELIFGQRIANIVLEVTKDPPVQGKPRTFSRLYSKDAIMLKFADRLANISEMESWNEKRQQQYLNKSQFWSR